MARERVNKKVLFIGSAVFVFLVLASIGVILYLSRDPEKFIRDGDAAFLAKDYQKAGRCYNKARTLAKTDSLRIEMLFRLVTVNLETDQWRNVLGCWNRIIQIDPKNITARFRRLEYFYTVADSGVAPYWQEVALQTSEFLDVIDPNRLVEDVTRWQFLGAQEKTKIATRLGPYIYLLRGRATLELTRRRAATDPEESLARAGADLEKVRELEPDNVYAYSYLAQAALEKGEIFASKGNFEERDKALDHATELSEQALRFASGDVRAHINFLTVKSLRVLKSGKEPVQSLEPEYLSFVKKFDSDAEAYSALCKFYLWLGPKSLDKAVQAVEKAVELDKENVNYAVTLADLHYRKFTVYGQLSEVDRAIEVANNALALLGAQDKPGPREFANRWNRTILYSFLADCYIQQVLEPRLASVRTDSKKQEWLGNAERAVHEIEQILGSGEDQQVIKWRGMLELAKGNRDIAVRKLYAVYEQSKASAPVEQRDAQTAYALAKSFEGTVEVGVVAEFLTTAINAGIVNVWPESLLDCAEVFLKLNMWTEAISNIDIFEQNFWSNERSRTLRVMAYINARQFDLAEEKLAKFKPDDPNAIKLNLRLLQTRVEQIQRAMDQKQMEEGLGIIAQQLPGSEKKPGEPQSAGKLMTAELKGYKSAVAGLVTQLLDREPNSVGDATVAAACDIYVEEGRIESASNLVGRVLKRSSANTTALFYKRLLSEPQPDEVSQQKRMEIEKEIMSSIAEPSRRALNLGAFYRRNNEPNKAAEEFKKVLAYQLPSDVNLAPQKVKDQDIEDIRSLAAGYLFDIAVQTKNLNLAAEVTDIAQRGNLDGCEGKFFTARCAVMREQYKDALAALDECLKQKPVFSYALLLRSNVNAVLGNENASIEDAQKAASLNPLDGTIAKVLMNSLHQRNRRLGASVSSNQAIEARTALDRALALNSGDLELLSFYADYIIPTEPVRALAIRQNLQKAVPSVQNAVSLGRLATSLALVETDTERKNALFDMAASAFEQAKKIDPRDKNMLANYAEYYRVKGQEQEARQLLSESDDKALLWKHYLGAGRFDDAKQILEQLHQAGPKDSNAVKGLLFIAEKAADRDAVGKYSEKLLSLEDSVENRLFQIQLFLEVGLLKEAEAKLQGFKEKYPGESRATLLEAWLVMRQGRLKKALDLVNQNLASNQDSPVAWRIRGEINLLRANYEQAISDFKSSKSFSDEPVVRVSLARAYLYAGRVEDAITELKNTIDDPQAPIEGRILLERIYTSLGKKDVLKKFYEETMQKFPDSLLWYNHAGAFAMTEGDFATAEQLYGQAWEKSQKTGRGSVESLDGYLHALLSGENFNKVFEEAGKCTDTNLAPVAYLRMAEAKLKLADKPGAIQHGRKALDKAFEGTDDNFAANVLQRTCSLLGTEEVSKYCKEKLEASPDSPALNFAMFNLANMNNEYNKAVDYIDKCLVIAGPTSPRRVLYISGKVGVLQSAYAKTSDSNYLKKAIAQYESLLAELPDNISILNNLAYMLAENNEKLPKALEYIERAREALPDNPDLMDTHAYVLYKNGKFSEASDFLQSALQQYQTQKVDVTSDVYEHLGMVKEKLGLATEAVAAYRQALEKGENTLSETAKKRIEAAIERLGSQSNTKD